MDYGIQTTAMHGVFQLTAARIARLAAIEVLDSEPEWIDRGSKWRFETNNNCRFMKSRKHCVLRLGGGWIDRGW